MKKGQNILKKILEKDAKWNCINVAQMEICKNNNKTNSNYNAEKHGIKCLQMFRSVC